MLIMKIKTININIFLSYVTYDLVQQTTIKLSLALYLHVVNNCLLSAKMLLNTFHEGILQFLNDNLDLWDFLQKIKK